MWVLEGMAIHGITGKTGCVPDVFVANSLIAMYRKFGMPEEAKKVFECMPERSLVRGILRFLFHLIMTVLKKVFLFLLKYLRVTKIWF